MSKILIVDPHRATRNSLKERLEYEGYSVHIAESFDAVALDTSCDVIDLVLCDEESFFYCANGGNSLKVNLARPVIVLTNSQHKELAIQVMAAGAVDCFSKPIDLNKLYSAVRQVFDTVVEPAVVPKRSQQKSRAFVEQIVGQSEQICLVRRLIDKVAPTDARVLIMGANGTGKELVARWLHEKSRRAGSPFVEVNCAAIPSELIESELFGHEKGSFTSAVRQRKGKFEQAHGGTLFLDEIGDMSHSAQAKVLRTLQDNRVSRVGGDKDIEVDVRIVAATNKNLLEEIRKGNFREDLYHRLSVIVINVPSLSARSGDIPIFVDYFIDKLSAQYGVVKMRIEPQAMEELCRMPWTGNIRELKNVIERLIILCEKTITLKDVQMYALGVI